jgi:hypothetical protein
MQEIMKNKRKLDFHTRNNKKDSYNDNEKHKQVLLIYAVLDF